jgi:hypothetical protein
MPIKYGDLTIIYNEQYTIFSFFGYKESKLIFLFEDDTICEVDDKIKNIHFKFNESYPNQLPTSFEKDVIGEDNKKIYCKTNPSVHTSGVLYMPLAPFFGKKYDKSITRYIASNYNGTYYNHKLDSNIKVFGILRIESSDNMPRYRFAYDSEEFTKEEVMYLINRIFTP